MRSDRRRNSPSPEAGGEDDGALDFEREGVLSFHALTMFLTDVVGERGDRCGRRIEEAVGVTVPEAEVKVLVKVLELVALPE